MIERQETKFLSANEIRSLWEQVKKLRAKIEEILGPQDKNGQTQNKDRNSSTRNSSGN